MFTKYDVPTLVLKILNDNKENWYTQTLLYNELNKLFKSSDELNIGHFLFVWEKLLVNNSIINVRTINTRQLVRINIIPINDQNKENSSSDDDEDIYNSINEPTIRNPLNQYYDFTYNVRTQVLNMIAYPELYLGSKLIEQFLLKLSNNEYKNIYQILFDKSLNLSIDQITEFIHLFGDNFVTKQFIMPNDENNKSKDKNIEKKINSIDKKLFKEYKNISIVVTLGFITTYGLLLYGCSGKFKPCSFLRKFF